MATAIFAHPLRDAIHSLKYNNNRRLAGLLAARMAAFWRDNHLTADLIVPVPLHASRLTERGYNQSALLARALGVAVGVPVAEGLLIRHRATLPQVALGQAERRQNVQGAFTCPGDVTGQRIVLVDDVCTTGATLEACADALKAGAAGSVWALTLARPRCPENRS
jgi:ComF family protein